MSFVGPAVLCGHSSCRQRWSAEYHGPYKIGWGIVRCPWRTTGHGRAARATCRQCLAGLMKLLMPSRYLLILAALEIEAKAMRAAVRGLDARVEVIGPGTKHLEEALRQHNPDEVRGIILAGLGGALDPSLAVGDAVIDPGDATWPASLPPVEAGLARRGTIHGADRIISTPAEKAALFSKEGALVVDMESGPIRRRMAKDIDTFDPVTQRNWRCPLLVIRAISDTADQTLDPRLMHLIDDRGRTRPIAVAALLLFHPLSIAALWRLRGATSLALSQLGKVVRDVVNAAEAWPQSPGEDIL